MQQDRLTTQLQSALGEAQSLAVGCDHAAIEPLHLIHGVLWLFGHDPLLMTGLHRGHFVIAWLNDLVAFSFSIKAFITASLSGDEVLICNCNGASNCWRSNNP